MFERKTILFPGDFKGLYRDTILFNGGQSISLKKSKEHALLKQNFDLRSLVETYTRKRWCTPLLKLQELITLVVFQYRNKLLGRGCLLFRNPILPIMPVFVGPWMGSI